MQQRPSSSSSSCNIKPSSDSGFSPGILHDLCSNTMEIRISIKSKSISLWIKGLIYYKKEKAPASKDKSICMRAMLLGNFPSRVKLSGRQLCCCFWTVTSLIWWQSHLNEWIRDGEDEKEIEIEIKVEEEEEEGEKEKKQLRILNIMKIQREKWSSSEDRAVHSIKQ